MAAKPKLVAVRHDEVGPGGKRRSDLTAGERAEPYFDAAERRPGAAETGANPPGLHPDAAEAGANPPDMRPDAALHAPEPDPHPSPAPPAPQPTATVRVRRSGRFSSLTARILALNVIAIAILVAGLLYLDRFRDGLIEAKFAALETEGRIIAAALGEGAAVGEAEGLHLDSARVPQILRRVAEPTGTRARLFDAGGALIADTLNLTEAGRAVQTGPLAEESGPIETYFVAAYDWVVDRLPGGTALPPYREQSPQRGADYAEVTAALDGQVGARLRQLGEGQVISVALPVQSFKKVLGALMLSADTADIEASVREQRFAILEVSGVALLVTVLLSLFLAGTIARPVRRLADAADKVRGGGRVVEIPDFTRRRDEIGDLSGSLRDMTDELYRRLGAIEAFAADVAHEIKNPLTSLRSAVEGLERSADPAQQERLLAIIIDDVGRIDRLISDISDASRLDVELTRSARKPVDVRAMCSVVAEVYQATAPEGAPALVLDIDDAAPLVVPGLDDRLGQVLRNVLVNAQSFSPPGGAIRLVARARPGPVARDDAVEIAVEDEGPGFPPEKLSEAFERFYTARPSNEAFGKHSGLGLSISRQIVEAHGGRIWAENRTGADGHIVGARVVMRLPVAAPD